jgi:hypothetical protein
VIVLSVAAGYLVANWAATTRGAGEPIS